MVCIRFLQASDEEKYDLVREGVVIFTGALAKHLEKVPTVFFPCYTEVSCGALFEVSICINTSFLEQDDPKVHTVVEKLLDVLNTPSEAVQRAVSSCLSPLMQSKQVFFGTLLVGFLRY